MHIAIMTLNALITRMGLSASARSKRDSHSKLLQGFYGDGYACHDIDECSFDSSAREQGFYGDGYACHDIDECSFDSSAREQVSDMLSCRSLTPSDPRTYRCHERSLLKATTRKL
ncbi:hypothetical protein ANCDUO_02286 [Ancylostoma duodenale]|uniref:Uncharacterized protein n=1 Tax=Ancylostoma duodenale TaxID=51022 RepID=A0A0C2HCX1_9BILA|nr:hypothetical protein ANCDUO_02286 [Ancylostoma duodenale]